VSTSHVERAAGSRSRMQAMSSRRRLNMGHLGGLDRADQCSGGCGFLHKVVVRCDRTVSGVADVG
jgi:hypothetical protein